MTAPKISVIVPAYNEEKYIEATLKSINKQTYDNLETIVVPNACTDDTAKIARKYTPNVYTTIEKGVAKARNLGAKKSNGEILTFIDADTVMKEDLLERVYLDIQEGYVGGKTQILSLEDTPFHKIFWTLDNSVDKLLFYKLGIPNICSYTPFVFCNKKDFESIGGFDEDLVATEEIQLLKKLRKKGKIKFIKDSYVKVSQRRDKKQGKFYGGFLVPFYHFFFPKSKKLPYINVR